MAAEPTPTGEAYYRPVLADFTAAVRAYMAGTPIGAISTGPTPLPRPRPSLSTLHELGQTAMRAQADLTGRTGTAPPALGALPPLAKRPRVSDPSTSAQPVTSPVTPAATTQGF